MANNSLNIPYIVLSGTVLIGIVLTIAVYQPMASETITLRNQIEEDTTILKDREEHLRGIQSRVNALNSQQVHEERLNVVLPNEDALEDALRVMHVAGQESGGNISSISDKSEGVQSQVSAEQVRGEGANVYESVTPLAFDVAFTGTYRELRVFLEKIEQSPRLMDVTNISMSKSGEGEQLTSSMTIQFYKYNLEELNT